MFTLTHLTTPPPESLKSQVLQMVVDHFSDISPAPLTPSNPLFQLYQYVIGFEVHLYLQAMGSELIGWTLANGERDRQRGPDAVDPATR